MYPFSHKPLGDVHTPRQRSAREPLNTTPQQEMGEAAPRTTAAQEAQSPERFQKRSCRMPNAPTALRGSGGWLRAWGGIHVKPSACHGTVVGTLPAHNQTGRSPETPFWWLGLHLPWTRMGTSPLGWQWADPDPAAALVPLGAAGKSGNLKSSDWNSNRKS